MSRRAGAQASHMTAQPSCDRRGLTGRRFFDFPERTPCDPVPPTNDSAYGGVGLQKVGMKEGVAGAQANKCEPLIHLIQ